MEMLGVSSSGLRLTLELPDRNGALAEADGLLRNFGVTVVSVVMMPRDAHKNLVQSIWRLQGCDDVDALLDFLREKSYRVVHFSESNVCTNI